MARRKACLYLPESLVGRGKLQLKELDIAHSVAVTLSGKLNALLWKLNFTNYKLQVIQTTPFIAPDCLRSVKFLGQSTMMLSRAAFCEAKSNGQSLGKNPCSIFPNLKPPDSHGTQSTQCGCLITAR